MDCLQSLRLCICIAEFRYRSQLEVIREVHIALVRHGERQVLDGNLQTAPQEKLDAVDRGGGKDLELYVLCVRVSLAASDVRVAWLFDILR